MIWFHLARWLEQAIPNNGASSGKLPKVGSNPYFQSLEGSTTQFSDLTHLWMTYEAMRMTSILFQTVYIFLQLNR